MVRDVVIQTYRFAFGRYPALLGVVWIPALMLIAAFYFVILPSVEAFSDSLYYALQPRTILDPAPPPDLGAMVLGNLVILCAYVWMGMGVVSEALGLRKGSRLFYLPGLEEGRVAGAYLALFAMAYLILSGIVLIVIMLGAMFLAGMGAGLSSGDLSVWGGRYLFVFLIVAVEIAAIYVVVRLSFLVLPVAVAEHRVSVVRSWRLMKGNVMCAIIAALAAFLPVFVFEFILGIAILGPAWIHPQGPVSQPGKTMADISAALRAYEPFCGLAIFALLPIIAGLVAGPSAFAYRALVPAAKT